MPELPSYVEAHMSESVLGRAKLKLYEVISGQEHWIPEETDVRRFIRSEYRKNPSVGKVFLIVLTENFLKRVSFTANDTDGREYRGSAL